jgi:hypothetical protein
MLRKLLLAATITLSLHLFLAVNSTSQSNFNQRSAQNTTQPTLISTLQLESAPTISENTQN